jgi:hypothetical protein
MEHLRSLPGVETVALANWALLSGGESMSQISINGGPPSFDPSWFLNVSPGWIDAMKIPLMDGRDFQAEDTYPSVAIINRAFAKRYFNCVNPLRKSFGNGDGRARLVVVGVVGLQAGIRERYAGARAGGKWQETELAE